MEKWTLSDPGRFGSLTARSGVVSRGASVSRSGRSTWAKAPKRGWKSSQPATWMSCGPAPTISSARRLASLTPRAGRSRRGGFRQGGFPPAVENREEPFERPRAGRVRALGGGRVLRQKPNDTAKPRRLLAKSGATVTRCAAPVGW